MRVYTTSNGKIEPCDGRGCIVEISPTELKLKLNHFEEFSKRWVLSLSKDLLYR